MANGDAAAAVGMDVVPSTGDVRVGYDEINKTRDYVANHQTTGTHPWSSITGKPDGLVLYNTGGSYVILLRSGTDLYFDQGGSWMHVLDSDDGNYLNSRIDSANASISGKVNAYGDAATSQYTQGPNSTAYNRTVTGGGFFAVWMDNTLQFGRNTSARKYKEDIQNHDVDIDNVLALQPVSYHRISDSDPDSREYGLIADDVEQTLPEICTYFDGEIDGIRYDLLAVTLLDVAKQQQTRINDLEERLAALEAKQS